MPIRRMPAGMNVDINFDKKYYLVNADEQGTITIRQNITIEAVKRQTVVLTNGEEIDPDTIYDNQKALWARISELLSDSD